MDNINVNNNAEIKNELVDKKLDEKQDISEKKLSIEKKVNSPKNEETDKEIIKSTPKKRGRKKKSEKVDESNNTDDIDELNFLSSETKTTSRRGRKRKSVNYFALANPDIIYDSDEDSQKKSKTKNDNSPLSNIPSDSISSIKSEDISNTKTNLKNIEFIKVEPNTSKFFDESTNDFEKSLSLGESILTSVGLNRYQSTETIQNESNNDVDVETQAFSDNQDKKKKYRKTGDTVRMISTLFSQFNATTNDLISNTAEAENTTQQIKIENEASLDGGNTSYSETNGYTCAVCKKEVTKTSWNHHKQRFHNNLAWRIGEPPLDLSDQKFVLQTLNALYKSKKPLYCDVCDISKKSVVGFLSHKSICGKSETEFDSLKEPCTVCGKKMFPSSLPSHMKISHGPVQKIAKAKEQTEHAIAKSKRQAATKAMKIIQFIKNESGSSEHTELVKFFDKLSFLFSNIASTMLQKQLLVDKKIVCKFPNCEESFQKLTDIKNHLQSCEKSLVNGYVCKHCLITKPEMSDIIYHIENEHDVIINDNFSMSSEDETDELKSKKSKLSRKGETNLLNKKAPDFIKSQTKKTDLIFNDAYKWTLEFCQENFSENIPPDIFPCLRSNWVVIDVNAAKEYLPKLNCSCEVGFETVVNYQNVLKKDHVFQRFQLFEPYLESNGNSTIFCGGPVNALAWCPTSYESVSTQIVAIAARNDPDKFYTNDMDYNESCLVQFWDFGPLKNLDSKMYRPRLNFAMSFDHGPIWHLEWCPSGCFESEDSELKPGYLKRMGALAVAGSDSSVYIYSIPLLSTNKEGKFFMSRPVIRLIPTAVQDCSLNKKKFYALRISWSKASGHRYLAVGYTNGMVAIFDLKTTSKILRRVDEQGINTLLPFKSFQAHFHYISALVLYHLNEGCRWLLTGSCDKSVSLWDLQDTSAPLTSYKRNIVNDGIWMSNWLCHVMVYDEASTIGLTATSAQQVRNYLSDILYLFHSSASVTCLTGSDWLNGIIQANSVGEIFAAFPKQLMVNLCLKNMKYKKLLLGYTAFVEKNKTVKERLNESKEKDMALHNKLTVKTNIKKEEVPLDREVNHLDYNPHYYKYEPLTYEEVDEKYGLLFCDHKMGSFDDFPPSLQQALSCNSKDFEQSKPNIYPLQAINRIEFNPNRQATTYYLTGYQAGFVRLTCLKFLQKEPQVIKDLDKINSFTKI